MLLECADLRFVLVKEHQILTNLIENIMPPIFSRASQTKRAKININMQTNITLCILLYSHYDYSMIFQVGLNILLFQEDF